MSEFVKFFEGVMKISSSIGETVINNRETIDGMIKALELLSSYSDLNEDDIKAIKEKEVKTESEKILLELLECFKAETPAKIMEQHYRHPNSVIMPTVKPIERIFDGITDLSEETDIRVSSKTSKKDYVVPTQVLVSATPDEGIKLPANLTPYDRAVFNGVCSIVKTGQMTFTAKQVYRAMGGTDNPNPQTVGSVTRSINKMRTSLITFDWTQHAIMNGLKLEKDDCIETNLNMLLCEGIKMRSNGQEVYGFELLKIPALLTYSENVGQVCTIERHLLDAPINKNEENITMIQYLARRIDRMKKNKGKLSRKMKYETILTDCGYNVEKMDKKTKSRKREYMGRILDYWTSVKYIKGYSEYSTGRSKTGVEINL